MTDNNGFIRRYPTFLSNDLFLGNILEIYDKLGIIKKVFIKYKGGFKLEEDVVKSMEYDNK